MILNLLLFVCVVLSVKCDDGSKQSPTMSTLEKYYRQNNSQEQDGKMTKDARYEVTTYKYPTATWSAPNYDKEKKKHEQEAAKLFLFKPSPFLKPPFTDGLGASITSIEDIINVNGRRKSKVRFKQSEKSVAENSANAIIKGKSKASFLLDKFLEESLMKYIKSANLTDEFGTISVETFSDALRMITEGRKSTMPPYDKNKEMRRKFRDDVLSPKKVESTTSGGLLEKQYQRRLQKTFEVVNENISAPSRTASLDRRHDWPNPDLTTMLPLTPLPTPEENYKRDFVTDFTTEPGFSDDEDTWPTTQPPKTEPPSTFYVQEERSRGVVDRPATKAVAAESVIELLKSEASLNEKPTIFYPIHPKKHHSKNYRGKKKYRDTIPSIREKNTWEDGEVQLSVAETVYYRPRQMPIQIATYTTEPEFGAIPGEPDKDYPMLSSAPSTGFKCPHITSDAPKMMADRKARCQVFYICTGDGPPAPMLCPNGTMFNENVLVCDWWYNVEC